MPFLYNSNLFGQPPQAIPTAKKDKKWRDSMMDWMEQYGQSELPRKQKRLAKNYKMVQGVIEVEDYISIDQNAYQSMYDTIEKEVEESILQDIDITAEDLNFYPIVPSIINVLVGELVKKFDHIRVKAVDDLSTNEYWDFKKSKVLELLLSRAQGKINQSLLSQGLEEGTEEFQQAAQSQQQEFESLPAIERFMQRSYRNDFEDWCNKRLENAIHKYGLTEKEPEVFKHQLTSDEAYWHVGLRDDDIDVEVWNPMEVFSIKPSHHKYTTRADMIGRQYYSTISDVISKYNTKIDHKIIESHQGNASIVHSLVDRNQGDPFDNQSNLVQEKRLLYFKYLMGDRYIDENSKVLITEGYWMSQRRLALLNAIYEGTRVSKIVDDTFEITIPAQYDEDNNLIAGEELEYFYAPQVWQGTKLNFSFGSSPNTLTDENKYLKESIFKTPKQKKAAKEDREKGYVYIDVQPLEYQFTDQFNPYQPIIPVAGCQGFEPSMNVGPYSLVDKTKAYQVGFNSCMNQIDNFLETEIGKFYILDHKLVPKHSIDGTWGGAHNWYKWILNAKENQLGVVDASPGNMEGQQNYSQPTVVDMLKTDQFKSRIELAVTFKNLLFESIGITPQRIGEVTSQETATGINQAVSTSYAQTEMYYVNHRDLMKQFKSLLLDAEKYVESKKPKSRTQYINSDQERVMFEIETDDFLLRRMQIYLDSNPDTQRILDQLRQLAIANNTSNASILDLATIIASNNVREIKDTLKASVARMEQQQQAQQQAEQSALQQQLEAQATEADKQRAFEAEQNERDRMVDMYIAEVKAVGFAEDNDINQTGINDALEVAKYNLETQKSYQEMLDSQQERQDKRRESADKMNLEREKLLEQQAKRQSDESMKNKELSVDLKNQSNDIAIERIRLQAAKIKEREAEIKAKAAEKRMARTAKPKKK